MTPRRRKYRRLTWLLSGFGIAALAVALILYGLNDTLLYFYSPSDLHKDTSVTGRQIRLGGLVEPGSIHRNGQKIDFAITDGAQKIDVRYEGTLPDLFHEGRGVVVEGMLTPEGSFTASRVLAKHDERYMPPEVVEALKKAGRWQESSGTPIKPAP